MFCLIAAIGKNRELGKDGELCFHIREDMKFFRETTNGHKVFMGRKTFESLPGKLPNREHFVLTRSPEKLPKGIHGVSDLDDFVRKNQESEEKIFVIGGGEVYKVMLPVAKEMFLTEVQEIAEADTFFPEFDENEWTREEIRRGEENGIKYSFAHYVKK